MKDEKVNYLVAFHHRKVAIENRIRRVTPAYFIAFSTRRAKSAK